MYFIIALEYLTMCLDKIFFKKANLKIYVKHRQLVKYIRIQGVC